MTRIVRLLTLTWLPLLLALIAIALVLPSHWTGWQQDDFVQRRTFLGFPQPAGRVQTPLNQFRFLDGDSAYTLALMDEGVVPWWTLVIRPEGGFLGEPFDNVVRDPSHPFRVGDQVQLTGFCVKITRVTDDGRPAEASFRFSVPLEDASLRWVRWGGITVGNSTTPSLAFAVRQIFAVLWLGTQPPFRTEHSEIRTSPQERP